MFTLLKNCSKDFTKFVKSGAGFSLIEILVALTLLALAGTFVAGKIFDSLYEGQRSSTKIQMQNLAGRLKEFRRHCNFYPTTDQGLDALITKPSGGRECKRYAPNGYIDGDQLPTDPWDNDFVYESDGKTFNIASYGRDGEEGGDGQDEDISFKKK
ncbi:MAG: type II secretion system major pseudopilin GspG [Bdellovibrionales bacterium]|jgi:general secretion pathway protein G|nr:type II secretion system major pseudopilin GspG [Bdellovibrionales bacterium]MBT3526716.1 type II secretion system major pseudopilin GspG [Bdellovibrionales bacterium]MBT7668435.1 type II secretion system major pseudopilin GspG [Bdellovibrionales bacterium]MBT7767897.1 type II secretion system major pseudopilin GspG [Bdellovibrionales bacterium]